MKGKLLYALTGVILVAGVLGYFFGVFDQTTLLEIINLFEQQGTSTEAAL